jgi:hypothetical protein
MTHNKTQTTDDSAPSPVAAEDGSFDHVLKILACHHHPFLLVGCAAQRWMGSAGTMTDLCEILIRHHMLKAIALDLLATGRWQVNERDSEGSFGNDAVAKCDADIVLRRTHIEDNNEFPYLALWSEITYHMDVDRCAAIEVPDVYCWQPILVEESWHPAMNRPNGWWYGPRVHPDTKVLNSTGSAHPNAIFFSNHPRGKSSSNPHTVFVPGLTSYLDSLIHHVTNYKISKPGLWALSSWQLRNLTRYLYLELDHQKLPLLIELEESEFMEGYLNRFVRKPKFVYRRDENGEFEATKVREWDPESYPEWCGRKMQGKIDDVS